MFDQLSLHVLALAACVLLVFVFPSCATSPAAQEGVFDTTLKVLQDNTRVALLSDAAGEARVVVTPELSARVMMSTWGGDEPPRLGWVNEPVVAGKERNPAFINYGGAERLWLSPEGGQFALFFKPGNPFDLDHWMTPTTFNSDPFEILDQSQRHIAMARDMKLSNYQGTPFKFRALRTVTLVNRLDLAAEFGVDLPDTVSYVGFTTKNALINRGFSSMSKQKGLVSLWILSQFDASPDTWVIFPFKTDDEEGQGPFINDDYFGKVPPERLKVVHELGSALFRCDSRRRTKIGLSFGRAKNAIGSISFDRNILTVVIFNLPRTGSYANNAWAIQKEPFGGDVVNSYNNGVEGMDADVSERFYELETLSPVKELEPGHRIEHINTTLHFNGSFDELNAISQALLGVDIEKVKSETDDMKRLSRLIGERSPGAGDNPDSRLPPKKEPGRLPD